ncbi:hypothetical protein [Nocardiopsis metallicus]|uniref:Uncharacterized protein n=1 Tax=Nocardiopsis metallicus TaxID=179819 RepID=A0A840WEC5_9ACTN|nr:hypothetical protein [Nocardiopsis metallicus]MBB5495329.1 hypothetical protein [Nocardiopsis metallicus]
MLTVSPSLFFGTLLMIGLIVLLTWIVRRSWGPTRRAPVYASFTGVVLLLVILTLPPTAYRSAEGNLRCAPVLVAGHPFTTSDAGWDRGARVLADEHLVRELCGQARTQRLGLGLLVAVPTAAAIAVAWRRSP